MLSFGGLKIWGFGRPIIGLAKFRLRNILSTFSVNSTSTYYAYEGKIRLLTRFGLLFL
jgi:hypothetical protein